MRKLKKIAVLVSDDGTRLQKIIDAIEAEKLDITIEIVISDRKCLALEKAQNAGIDIWEISDAKSVDELNNRLYTILDINDVDLVVLAGYSEVIGINILDKYIVINVQSYPV